MCSDNTIDINTTTPIWTWKVIIIGDSGVGKSKIISHYMDDKNKNSTITLPNAYYVKNINIDGNVYGLSIWDTAGQEKYRSLVRTYFRGSNAILLVYDVTDRTSFINCEDWLKQLLEYKNPNMTIILIGNKIDLDPNNNLEHIDITNYMTTTTTTRKVSTQEGLDFAKANHLLFAETSAISGTNIHEIFHMVTKELICLFMNDIPLDIRSNKTIPDGYTSTLLVEQDVNDDDNNTHSNKDNIYINNKGNDDNCGC